MQIHSPFEVLSNHTKTWSAKVLAHFTATAEEESYAPLHSTVLEEILQQQNYVHNLAWSPAVVIQNKQIASFLVYTTNKSVVLKQIKLSRSREGSVSFTLGNEKVLIDEARLQHDAPLAWYPKVWAEEGLLLVAFTQTHAHCFLLHNVGATVGYNKSSLELDGRWDSISGMCHTL